MAAPSLALAEQVTDAQLKALQGYVVAVTQFVTGAFEHEWRVRRILEARKSLETAFGVRLPDYPDLFPDVPAPQPPAIPDLL